MHPVLASAKPTRFRDLRIRLKLMVMHNVFFLVLAGAVYYAVIPVVEQHLADHSAQGLPETATPERVLTRAKLQLFAALGVIYVLAVLTLELFVMPRYVYQPIQATLEADEAVQDGDRLSELIPDTRIPGDEIGDIMRSRNATVEKLREKELTLERALARLGELAQDLQRKNDQLENARKGMAAQDRLATIGLLSASVAHELNTPLSVIRGTVEKLLETVEEPQERARLERVGRMADRLHSISEGLLDFSRVRREEQRRPTSLRSLLDEAWNLLALDDRAAGVGFHNEVDEEAYALGDYERLMQVFVNLLKNGLYALDGPGAIWARSRQEIQNGRSWVVVEVDDSGKGIPPDVLPSLFEAFVSTRLDSRGTGLGLTVADGIVQQHGGQIVAANRPEGGARLTVRLPAAEAPKPAEAPAEV
jgi:signal transduction histidine kinase